MELAVDNKKALRHAMKKRRSAVSADERVSAARLAALNAEALLEVCEARIVAAYHPVRDELDTLPLIAQLTAAGLTTALPTVVSADEPLEFRRWSPGAALALDGYGIAYPPDEDLRVVPDALIIPLLAFDIRGARLGYGGGHYDRTLETLRAHGKVVAIGFAYEFQEVDLMPLEAHDQPLDWIVTPSGARRLGKLATGR